MQSYNVSLETLKSEFKSNSIDFSYPGFYDQPNFMKMEKRNAEYLVNYASFIEKSNYNTNYSQIARKKIDVISGILFNELKNDGRKGACIDLSMVLSRILEKESLWNYMVCGTLTIIYPNNSGINNTYFWDMDITNAKAGHVWVIAPPFRVIDLTLKIQDYPQPNNKYIPNYILAEKYLPATYNVEDICSPEILLAAKSNGIQKDDLIFTAHPERKIFYNEFKGSLVEIHKTRFKYIPSSITASDQPFEQITALNLNERLGLDIYNDLIKPKLKEIK